MMSLIKKGLLVMLLLMQAGCFYMDTKFPLDRDVSVTSLGTKQGVSSTHSVLWLVAWGDGGVGAAARNGGLKVINHLDSRMYMVLFGLYTRVDTIAYGD